MPKKKAGQAKAPKMTDEERMAQMERDLLEKHRKEIAEECEQLKRPELEELEEEPETETETETEDVDEGTLLISPTRELNLQPDLSRMSLREYVEELLELSRAETAALSALGNRAMRLEDKVRELSEKVRNMSRLERSLGFGYTGYGKWIYLKMNPCPHCGQSKPTLQLSKFEANTWLVICDNCWTRAESAEGPMQAIRNWNEGKETEISRMLNRPLSKT
mgnify:CR=1 FL=1